MRALLLRLLKLDARPDVPTGSTDSVSMFRASTRYFWYSILGWGAGQAGALFGILIPLGIVDRVLNLRLSRIEVPDMLADAEVGAEMLGFDWRVRIGSLIDWVEIAAVSIFVIQLVISFLLLRLAWEMRWYIVTDTAIRIREGLVRTREQTLTIAKIQNMRTRQGPLQRLFGIADLEVRTAGGGASGSSPADNNDRATARLGRFRGLDDVRSLRDRLRRLQARHRDSGVDAPDRTRDRPEATAGGDHRLTATAERMLGEVRALRQALESGSR